jgi:DNA modification methylase
MAKQGSQKSLGKMAPRHRVEPGHIKDLIPDPANRRSHNPRNLGMLVDALQKVGVSRSIVVDEDGVILAGNGVVEAASEAGLTKLQIVEADGETLVAVRRRGLTPSQKRDLAIYDNRTAELAEWNIEQLAADLQNGEDLSAFFFDEELKTLLGSNGVKAGRTDPDEVPAERPTGIVLGDLFELGAHRLLCGDCTVAGDVARLLGDVVPFLMVTDPPYGVDYDPQWREDAAAKGLIAFGATRLGTVANDDVFDWTPAWQLFPGSVVYVWHAGVRAAEVAVNLLASSFYIRSQIIWRKRSFAISRGHYHWQHEPCWYAVRKGATSRWCGDHSQSTIWDVDAVGMSHMKGEDAETNHGTQKPVECMLRPIRHHGGKDDHVYDPFVGSGTTIIAAEQVERRCFALEITPTYCQMAIDRWEAFTGQKAVKVGEAVRV